MELLWHPLVLPIAVTSGGGFLCLFVPPRADRVCAWLSVLVCATSVYLVAPFVVGGDIGLDAGGALSLRLDRLSALVLVASAVFALLIALYSAGWMRNGERRRYYFVYLLWTVSATFAAILANDVLLFVVCWGFLAVTLHLMINLAGPGAAGAARKSLMIVGGADATLVLGAVLFWTLTGTTRLDGPAIAIDGVAASTAFVCFVIAAFAKAGAVPLHTWVPDCGEHADAPVSAFLPASLDKLLGIYLLVRVCHGLFELSGAALVVLVLLGAATIIVAVMMALVQRDLKRLLAYHAVSQVGYMVLGIASGTALGIAGGVFHMLNHAVYKSALFLGAGAVERQAGTSDLDRLGGLSRSMPATFIAFGLAALAISGVPPLNGFASKWMVYQAIIDAADRLGPVWIVCLIAAMLGSALTLASFVKVLHATFLCKPSPTVEARGVSEVGTTMLVPMLVLAAVCVLFGVFAYTLPLKWLILPAAPAETVGVWWSGPATLLMLVAITTGLIVYLFTMRSGRIKRVETYVGGERLDDVYVRDEPVGRGRHIEVTGSDFYATIEQLAGLRWFYARARRGVFDIYYAGARVIAYVTTLLRGAHSGFLPLYLLWFMVGVIGVVYVLTAGGKPS